MSRHQTSDDHDHGYIKSKERRYWNIESYKCPVCGNIDIHSIGYLNGKPYCRRCISFRGEEVEHKPSCPKKAHIHLEYELSPEQKELSDKLVENYKKGIDSLVYAVCGSGKTEISLQIIQYAIKCGEKVAFALPRRDVAIELYDRLRTIFKYNRVVCLYGGHTKHKEGDIIVLTTHQLYRYKDYFGLIVLDEIDAFPFKNDPLLHEMFYKALCGHYVMMSATPSKEVIQHFRQRNKDILHLSTRFHKHPLPVPTIKECGKLLQILFIIRKIRSYLKVNKPVFIFAPTIDKCERLFFILNIFLKGGNYVHSQRTNRKEIIENFRNGMYRYLVTTSVLERGVTVRNLQVIVCQSGHKIYEKGTLIQIAGRAGRKADAPTGDVIFLCEQKNKEMLAAITDIEESNRSLKQ